MCNTTQWNLRYEKKLARRTTAEEAAAWPSCHFGNCRLSAQWAGGTSLATITTTLVMPSTFSLYYPHPDPSIRLRASARCEDPANDLIETLIGNARPKLPVDLSVTEIFYLFKVCA